VRVILLRHGIATGQTGRATGHDDPPLDPAGAAAITALRDAHEGPVPPRIWSSDLRRAHASATLLAERWSLPVTMEPRLRELHFGRWEGRAWTALEAEEPEALRDWMARWWEAPAPGGESLGDLRHRVLTWWHECLLPAAEGQALHWVGTHAGAIRALVGALVGTSPERSFDLACGHARAVHLELRDGVATVRAADVARLGAD